MRLRVGGAEHAEPGLGGQRRELQRRLHAALGRGPLASPRGGSPRSASTLSAPPARGLRQQLYQLLAREPGRGDVRDGFQPALARQSPHDGRASGRAWSRPRRR